MTTKTCSDFWPISIHCESAHRAIFAAKNVAQYYDIDDSFTWTAKRHEAVQCQVPEKSNLWAEIGGVQNEGIFCTSRKSTMLKMLIPRVDETSIFTCCLMNYGVLLSPLRVADCFCEEKPGDLPFKVRDSPIRRNGQKPRTNRDHLKGYGWLLRTEHKQVSRSKKDDWTNAVGS